MRYVAKVLPEVSRTIRRFGLDRSAVLQLLNWLYAELEEGRVDSYRRNPERRVSSDRCFWCEAIVWERGHQRAFRFIIDDTTAPGYLLVVAVDEL